MSLVAHEVRASSSTYEHTTLLKRPVLISSSSARVSSSKLVPGGPDDRSHNHRESQGSGEHKRLDKIVQCAFDGEMLVGSISMSEFARQLRQSCPRAVPVSCWCDGCAEPLRSWIKCSSCVGSAYCFDCFMRSTHTKHTAFVT